MCTGTKAELKVENSEDGSPKEKEKKVLFVAF